MQRGAQGGQGLYRQQEGRRASCLKEGRRADKVPIYDRSMEYGIRISKSCLFCQRGKSYPLIGAGMALAVRRFCISFVILLLIVFLVSWN